jgi:hypothetical protein
MASNVLMSLSPSQEVNVTGLAIRSHTPEREKHGPFQNKPISIFRNAQAIEKTLQAVAGQYVIKVDLSLPGQVKQSLPDRGRRI